MLLALRGLFIPEFSQQLILDLLYFAVRFELEIVLSSAQVVLFDSLADAL